MLKSLPPLCEASLKRVFNTLNSEYSGNNSDAFSHNSQVNIFCGF